MRDARTEIWLAGALIAACLTNSCACLSRAEESPGLYKTKFRVVNAHRHAGVASEAVVRAELETLDRVGIEKVIILDGGSPSGSLPAWLKLQAQFRDRLIVFAKIDFASASRPTFFADLVRDLEANARLGIRGVKVWKDLGMYVRDATGKLLAVDDPRLDPFWARCGELGLPVLIHTADPREYWYPLTYNSLHYGLRKDEDQHYHNPEMASWAELMRQRDHVLEKHPRTTFIGAHMGSLCMDLKQLGDSLDKYPNFNVDCAARLRMLGRLNPPAVRDFFVKYQDRILFGSDDMILGRGRKRRSPNITIYPAEDPDLSYVDVNDAAEVRRWQDKSAADYATYLQYFETDRVDLPDPNHSGGEWLRIFGVRLPRETLEKFYYENAARLIPGVAGPARQ